MGLIVAWNKLQKKVETKVVRPVADFWEYQVVRMGEPVGAVTHG
jgi:hypothetical protein